MEGADAGLEVVALGGEELAVGAVVPQLIISWAARRRTIRKAKYFFINDLTIQKIQALG